MIRTSNDSAAGGQKNITYWSLADYVITDNCQNSCSPVDNPATPNGLPGISLGKRTAKVTKK
jgi:hypothetical protein